MIFDIIVLAVILISALHAFWRGLIREVLTIFGAIGGLFAALAFGPDLRPLMDGWLGVEQGANATKLFDMIPMTLVSTVLSYAAIFIIIFGVLSFISHLIAEQVRALGLGAVDRTLGVVFGVARGLLIVGIFYLPIHLIMDKNTKNQWFRDSRTHVIVTSVSELIENLLPDNMLPFEPPKDGPDGEAAPSTATTVLDTLKSLKGTAADMSATQNNSTSSTPSAPAAGDDTSMRSEMDRLINKTSE